MTRSSGLGKKIALGFFLACALALIVLEIGRNNQSGNDLEASSVQEKQPSLTPRTSKNNAKREGSTPPQPLGISIETQDEPVEALASSEVKAILQQTDLSLDDSAARLLECTRSEDLPMQVRLDALDHAFNLDRWQALTLCMEKPLAKPIAERLLSGIHNLNESPQDQVSATMHLIMHEDEEIRKQAQKLLAFLISAEKHAANPEKLREAADEFLKQADEANEEVIGQ